MNKKRASVLAVVIAAAFSITPAVASANDSPGFDFVVGAGQNNPARLPINHFVIAATSDSDGSDPFGIGHFFDVVSAPPLRAFGGPVVCLNVVGNRASIVFEATHELNQPPALNGGGDLMFVEDNGHPSHGVSPDLMINTRLNAARLAKFETNGCPPPKAISSARHLSSGNIVVHDAS